MNLGLITHFRLDWPKSIRAFNNWWMEEKAALKGRMFLKLTREIAWKTKIKVIYCRQDLRR